MRLNQVTLPAREIAASVAFYQALGFTLIVLDKGYARFVCPDGGSSFSLHHSDTPANTDTVIYFECDDLDERVEKLQAQGIVFSQEPKDEPWLWREARLEDPNGNVLCLYYAGKNRLTPPWRLDA